MLDTLEYRDALTWKCMCASDLALLDAVDQGAGAVVRLLCFERSTHTVDAARVLYHRLLTLKEGIVA